jgi:hypothetical protein
MSSKRSFIFLLLQLLVLGALLGPIDGLADHVQQAILGHRLLEEVERAGLSRFDRARHRPLPADHYDLRPGVNFLQAAQELDPVNIGQHQVGYDDVGAPLLEHFFAACPDQSRPDFVTFRFDDHLEPLGHRWLVVYRQNSFAALVG